MKNGILICTLIMSLALSSSAFAAVNEEEMSNVTNFVNEVYPNISDEEKAELVERLYNERTNSNVERSAAPAAEPYIKEEDPLYMEMENRVNYVVALINDMGSEATKFTWEDNLDFLTENYNEIKAKAGVDMSIVDTYIEERKSAKEHLNEPSKKVYEGSSLLTANGYDYDSATSYANQYLYNYNSDYPDWTPYGGDCANFASQCLYAGGKSMSGSDPDDPLSWFSYGSATDTSQVAGAWRGANMFKNYWTECAPAYQDFSEGGIDTYNYTWPGDVVSMLYDDGSGVAYHTLICYTYNSSAKSTTVYSHTGTPSRNLSTVSTPLRIFHMRDSY